MSPRGWCVAFATALVALTLPAAAGAQAEELAFVSPDKLALTASDGSSKVATVWLRNATGAALTPKFGVDAETGDGKAVPARTRDVRVVVVDDDGNDIDPPKLAAKGVGRYRLVLRGSGMGKDVSGELVARDAAEPPAVASATLGLSVSPKSFADQGVTAALIVALGLAVIIVVIAWGAVADWASPGRQLGALALDFQTSFASTLTAAGALLGTVVAAGVLPEETVNLPKTAFVALNLLFGVAIVAAAFLYAATLTSDWAEKEGDPTKEVQTLQGRFGPYMGACLITLWAVFGELWTLWLLIDELGQDQGFSSFGTFVLKALILASAVGVIPYTFWRIRVVASLERDAESTNGILAFARTSRPRRVSLL